MDDKQKLILDRNRSLLIGNIIPTEHFFHLLKTEHVLTDTMVRDVQSRRNQEERNMKLLELLKLRGGDVYRRFRHVLYLSGHLFLADHLYGEDIETKLLKADEVFDKFPKLFNHVSDDTKAKLLKFLETKVREKAVTNAWLTSGPERAEVMESRKILFDAEKDYKIKLETKTKKLCHLKEEINRLKDEIKSRDNEALNVEKDIADMQKSFKDDLAKQSRFNAANNHSIMQLRERFDSFNERIRGFNVAVRRFLEPEQLEEIEDDPDNVKLSLLERNIRKLIQVARTNIESTSSNVTEKEAVLSILKTSGRNKTQTLPEIVQQYVDKQEKGKAALAKELDLILDIVRGQKFTAKMSAKPKTDLKWLRSQMAMLREEVDHMKKKIEWKDNQISDLIKENSDLREHSTKQTINQKTVSFPFLSAAQGSRDRTRDTPDFTKEVSALPEHFDKYTKDSRTPPPSRRQSAQRRGSLADVMLERPVSPLQRSRRQSKFDAADIDILGTAPRYRRSMTELRCTDTFGSSSSASLNTLETKHTHLSPQSSRDKANFQSGNKLDSADSPVKDFVTEGRRHSLAELITIYENTTRDTSLENNETNNRLPVLQET